MKRFKYRLERVLEYRKLVKDDKVRELLHRNNKLFADNEKLKELQIAELLNRIDEETLLTAEEVLRISMYGERIRAAVDFQKVVVIQSEDAVKEATAEYIEAAKDEKTLATHKDRKLAEYTDYANNEDAKSVDELNIQRSGMLRRNRE
jgi:flagellar export protein FliJ